MLLRRSVMQAYFDGVLMEGDRYLMGASPMATLEVDQIVRLQALHELAQVAARRLQHRVVVIVGQAREKHNASKWGVILRSRPSRKSLTVLAVANDRLARFSSLSHGYSAPSN